MYDNNKLEEDDQDESAYYGYWRDIAGNLKPRGTFVRNGRVVPCPPFDMTEPELTSTENQEVIEKELSASYLEIEDAAFFGLNQEERHIARLAMVQQKANGEIGQIMGVSRSAISQRLRNIARKNQAVRMWWRRKKKTNQHV